MSMMEYTVQTWFDDENEEYHAIISEDNVIISEFSSPTHDGIAEMLFHRIKSLTLDTREITRIN